jgi:hypothetical protein
VSKEIRFEVADDQFERLKAVENRRGYTWKGLILEGADALDTDEAKWWDRE